MPLTLSTLKTSFSTQITALSISSCLPCCKQPQCVSTPPSHWLLATLYSSYLAQYFSPLSAILRDFIHRCMYRCVGYGRVSDARGSSCHPARCCLSAPLVEDPYIAQRGPGHLHASSHSGRNSLLSFGTCTFIPCVIIINCSPFDLGPSRLFIA
jgi:hypothetical protein